MAKKGGYLLTYQLPHSMAMGNLNKIKETKPTTTTALRVAPYGTFNPQKLKSPLLDQNLLGKSTSECEDCAARFITVVCIIVRRLACL